MSRAVVTACNLGFAEGARGLLTSVRHFHPDVVRYCLAPETDAQSVQEALGDLAKVVTAPRKVRGVPDKWLLQLLAARIFIPEFPEEFVAWVDCDVVFCGKADELWDVPQGKVNVIKDAVYNLGRMVPSDVWDQYARLFHVVKTDSGFNAGIYALRKTDWLDLPERYEQAIVDGQFAYYPPGFDQALLNGLMRHRVNWLDRKYNAHAVFELGLPADVRVVHYTDNPKPWMPGYGAHRPGYYEWVRFGEPAPGQTRLLLLKTYYLLNSPRRLGYKAIRKLLSKMGLWRSTIGVSNGPQ